MSAMLADERSDQASVVVDHRPESKRVVIIGGGFAGLAAAHALRQANADLMLIDRRNHHIFQPLLYQVATAVLSPAEIAAPIRQLEAKQRNVTVLLAEVTYIDIASRTIEASSPGAGARKIAYDYLVVATGMRPNYFGHDEFARYAPGLKSLTDAETIRAKILSAFELAGFRALLLPFGAPVDFPPCIWQRPFVIAGDRHEFPRRVLAPHLGAS
jgi:NADH dehydrogenase